MLDCVMPNVQELTVAMWRHRTSADDLQQTFSESNIVRLALRLLERPDGLKAPSADDDAVRLHDEGQWHAGPSHPRGLLSTMFM